MTVYNVDVNGFSVFPDADGWVCDKCYEFTSFADGDELVWATDTGEIWQSTCRVCGAAGPSCIENWSPELEDGHWANVNPDAIGRSDKYDDMSDGAYLWLIARCFLFEG